jgi:hypothetical protein
MYQVTANGIANVIANVIANGITWASDMTVALPRSCCSKVLVLMLVCLLMLLRLLCISTNVCLLTCVCLCAHCAAGATAGRAVSGCPGA